MQGLETGERCRQIADIIAGWVLGKTDHVDTTVVEWPKVYRVGRSKGDPNDLLLLAALVGGVSCRLGARTVSPVPSEWIGSLPKTTTGDPLDSPRGRLIWRLLDASERAAVVVSHDSLDSAGLGLWALGRLGKVFPGTV